MDASRCCRSINFPNYSAPHLLLLPFPPFNFLLPVPSKSVWLCVKRQHEWSGANVPEAAGALLRWHRFDIHCRITNRADFLSGNKFLGNDSDTNIVKIYRMLDKKCPDQYHYYQRNSLWILKMLKQSLTSKAGIGTYAQNQTSNSSTPRGLFSRLKASIEFSIDQAIGTSFVHHVLAGYRFLMRYYSPGDHIYIFGFSRGAYTARFLAEMVHDIGLLSKGNEEMVHFAWNTFSDYQRTRSNTEAKKEKEDYMSLFNKTFCRPMVDVYFLGLFDCVNSVGQFEIPLFRKSSPWIPTPTAKHTRHAVSIHERRLKFKPALFELDDSKISKIPKVEKVSFADNHADIPEVKEMWFAGNHADIGGGWEPVKNKRLLSDIPLEWMIQEIKSLEAGASHLAIDEDQELAILKSSGYDCNAPHDMLARGSGTSTLGILGWWILGLSLLPIRPSHALIGNRNSSFLHAPRARRSWMGPTLLAA